MKVLICIPSLAIGGAEKFVLDLAVNLKRDNYDVVVAETRNKVHSVFRRMLEEHEIKIVDLTGKSYLEMLKKQICYLANNHFDVIHANIGSVLHTMLVCWMLRIPRKFYTIHNEPKLLYGDSIFKKMVYKTAFSFFGFVPVAISQTIRNAVASEFGIDRTRIPIVNNGVDIERFVPTEFEKHGQDIRLISVGTLYWVKNQKMLIDATINLHNRGYIVSLDILGEGEDRCRLETAIAQCNADSYIFLHGRKEDIEVYLQRSDIYVSASKTEGLPLSILEAMACGLPIVATDVGGTKDIVIDGVNGFLVSADSQEELETAIENLINDHVLRKDLGYQSRNIAEKWSLSNCVNNYENLYDGKQHE